MSKYRDGAAVRRERIMRILAYIKSNPGVLVNDVQLHMSFRTGLSPGTTSKYIQELVEYGLVAVDGQGFRATGKKI